MKRTVRVRAFLVLVCIAALAATLAFLWIDSRPPPEGQPAGDESAVLTGRNGQPDRGGVIGLAVPAEQQHPGQRQHCGDRGHGHHQLPDLITTSELHYRHDLQNARSRRNCTGRIDRPLQFTLH